ncbi:MAG: hypothetical protein M5U22_17290 [Thermoleophilia bacterium]|nr:hypothetical protein [Thermoleophilia bacterium]
MLVAAGFLAPGFWLLAAAAVVYVAMVEYSVQRPRLGFVTFLLFSVAEHAAYQVGVALGCLRLGSFRSYGLKLRWVGGRDRPPTGRSAARAPQGFTRPSHAARRA